MGRTFVNVKSIPLREYQLYQLNILKEFVRICEKNSFTYWGAWGTLLGCARHKGFIPWDDDIDVWMPAKDYLAFREACKKDLSDSFYIQSHALNPCNFITWQRIGLKNSMSMPVDYSDVHAEWGVCMDIFPLLDWSGKKEEKEALDRDILSLKRTAWRYEYLHEAKSESGVKRILTRMKAWGSDSASAKRFAKKERQLLCGRSREENNLYSDLFDFNLDRSWFRETKHLEFEGMTLAVPGEYEKVLDEIYGNDWAEIPPEEKRVCHSGGGSDKVLVSLNESYVSYLK